MSAVIRAFTAGEIAKEAGVLVSRVQYVCRTRDVRPMERVGIHRLFSETDKAYILSELRRIDRERMGVAHA